MDLKVVKIINNDKKYKAKNGKEYARTNYYLVVNGNYINIRPSFKTDFAKLDLFCNVIQNGESK